MASQHDLQEVLSLRQRFKSVKPAAVLKKRAAGTLQPPSSKKSETWLYADHATILFGDDHH